MVTVSGIQTNAPAKTAGPVAQMSSDPNRIEYETDSAGRRIGVRKLTFLDLNRLSRILGDSASNTAVLSQALMAAVVVEIDGDRVTLPVSLPQLEALMQRLDFHGIAAANKATERFSPEAEGDADLLKK